MGNKYTIRHWLRTQLAESEREAWKDYEPDDSAAEYWAGRTDAFRETLAVLGEDGGDK